MLDDEKIGQLISLRNFRAPKDPRNQRLHLVVDGNQGAVVNLNVDSAVWRWVQGFHAALYREPVSMAQRAIVTPFPRGSFVGSGELPVAETLPQQHQTFVRIIKLNRALGNLDRVTPNRGKLIYECVWVQSDGGAWMCVFAIDIYDWKDLGYTQLYPARGCAGYYVLPAGTHPDRAAMGSDAEVDFGNSDPLDPFGS